MKIVYDKVSLEILYADSIGLAEPDSTQGVIEVNPLTDSIEDYEIQNQNTDDGVDNYVLVKKDAATVSATRESNQWGVVRKVRTGLLNKTDWTQSADSPLTDSKKTEWSTYRQALRDVTTQSDPFNITWPQEPS